MSTYGNGSSLLGKMVTWFVVGVLAIVALKVGFAVAGVVLRLGFIALFTLGPILVIGWILVKLVRYFTRGPDEMPV
jgi:hypothetical protein